jgi:hypothetical protein
VADGNPLGAPRGSRGVDDIGAVGGGRNRPGRRGRASDLGSIAIDQYLLRPACRQRREQVRFADHHRGARVLQHERQAIARVTGVERHVGGPRGEHPQERDQHLQRAIEEDRHAPTGTHTEAPQVRGEAQGPLVQQAVAEALALEPDRHGSRAAGGSSREHGQHGCRPERPRQARIPEREAAPSLALVEQR